MVSSSTDTETAPTNGLNGHPDGNSSNAYPPGSGHNGYSNGNEAIGSGHNGYSNGNEAIGSHANGNFSQWEYGGNPLAHANTGDSARLPPFAGYLQPGLYRAPEKKGIANPAPLGLAAFALTTFLLSLINFHTRGVTGTSIVIGPAFAYGGLIQLLAGMW